jgi:hypothetical protein
VAPWLGVEHVPAIGVPPGHEQRRCIQIRAGEQIVRGPVSLDQLRRAWANEAPRTGLEAKEPSTDQRSAAAAFWSAVEPGGQHSTHESIDESREGSA